MAFPFRPQVPVIGNRSIPRMPPPSHRHASPAGPWPWIDLQPDANPASVRAVLSSRNPDQMASREPWSQYPQSLYPNWRSEQIHRSRIEEILQSTPGPPCVVHYMDVNGNGQFSRLASQSVDEHNSGEFWDMIQRPVSHAHPIFHTFDLT